MSTLYSVVLFKNNIIVLIETRKTSLSSSYIFSCLFLLSLVFSGRWRVISAQTDGESCCRVPEGKDACCARSDQAEFCSQKGKDVQLHLFLLFLFLSFFFAHWRQAGKFLETPLTSLTADFKYRPQSVK